jgi:tetratricopeptide (TPR) repeat protein
MGEQAIKEYQEVLDKDPNNLASIDGIGSILYNMAGTPFDPKKMEDSKVYHEKHIQISPDDPEPYYWMGVIDWSIAFRGNRDIREEYNKAPKNANKRIGDNDPMPPAIALKFAEKYGPTVDEGLVDLQKATTLRTDYDDALAYLNLLYRQKADMETSAEARDHDIDLANDLVDKVKAIKQRKMEPTS